MIFTEALAPLLRDAVEGEILVCGQVLKGLSAQAISWVVIEAVEESVFKRITLHAYWHDVFLVSKVVRVHNTEPKLVWSVTGGTK